MSSTTAVALSGIGQFTRVSVGFRFGDLGYIGKPYHMELDFCIDLTKGVSPMFKPEKRQQVLDQKLEKAGSEPEGVPAQDPAFQASFLHHHRFG
jgi:hypothetical protein